MDFLSTLKSRKDSCSDLYNSVKDTYRNHWLRIWILILLICILFIIYSLLEDGEFKKIFLHFAIEFTGVLFLFILIEHGLDKLNSGISETDDLRIDLIIDDIRKSNSVLIYDIYLHTLLSDDFIDKFRENCTAAFKKNNTFSVKILLLSLEAKSHIHTRATQLGTTFEELHANMMISESRIKKIEKDFGNSNFKVGWYKDAPLFSMYYVKKCMNVSFFQDKTISTQSPQLYVPEHSELGRLVAKFYKDEFYKIWSAIFK